MSADATVLVYYTLETARDAGFGSVEYRAHPELHAGYVSVDGARAAGDAVFARELAAWQAKLAAYDPLREASEARRSFESEKRSACFVETRITKSSVGWEDATYRGHVEWKGRLTIHTESRHRWREAVMKTVVAKDGTTTITHGLGKALPWSAWTYGANGGLYVPPCVDLVVRETRLALAATREQLVAWAGGGQ